MTTLTQSTALSQACEKLTINSWIEALLTAVDTGYQFGHEDATEGRDQCASAYFIAGTPAWNAYNEGYRDGCVTAAILTGQSRTYVQFSVARQPDVIVAYAPFQREAAAYADVLPAWQREDWVGE